MIDLKHRLIIDYSSLKSVAQILTNKQSELTVVFFTLGILFEFFGEWNFLKVLKRIVICFIILAVFETLFKSSLDLSFGISNSLIDQCKNTEFCSHYLSLNKGGSADATLWHETVNMVTNFSSFWLHALVSLIFKMAFVFTIQIYSLVYALTSIAYPLICTLGILPAPGEKAFISLFQTLLWLFISPIILSVVIVLLASVTEVGMGPKGEVGIEGMLHLMIISLFSLGSLFLSWLLCKGDGGAAFGAQMAQMGTSVLSMAGIGGMMTIGKGGGSSLSNLGAMAGSLGSNKLKGHVSSKVAEGLKNKGIEVGAHEIGNSKNSFMNSPLVPKGSVGHQSLSRGEKLLHSVDSIINAKENSLAKQGIVKDFKKVSSAASQNNSNGEKFKVSDYKENARKRMSPNFQSPKSPFGSSDKTQRSFNKPNHFSSKKFNAPRTPSLSKNKNPNTNSTRAQ